MRLILSVLAVALLVSGCSRERLVSRPGLTVVETEALPEPTRGDLVAADRPALVGPLDTIGIDVYGISDLSLEVQIDASGRISMPLAGTIDVRGKAAYEVARDIENALRRYVKDPVVTVNILNSVSQVVTVDGSVTEPGLYPVTNQMTLMRAIASAKGVSEFGKLEDVVVLRTVDNQRMAGLYNIAAIRRGVYKDPPIFANDVIIVGDSPERRLFRDLVALSPIISAPLIVLLQ
ncbi:MULTISPECIES: polysaccharide biosynthesis/export family protein [unclassified Sphingomonas]|jgi:polysaccharide export outer membrane protein|uniref:polysaccharide biosynthesis/export family protein n=1 Tax=unclassified Sphingomonas TaxID=196159 RepID=UPI000AE0E27E|nr:MULTISPECIES: polysaccharide biosynthesis/export family protein [unclassified Sphingomonas]MCH4891859.1 polysaccharide export protein [Sphingomonas sp. SFZ2018-12]